MHQSRWLGLMELLGIPPSLEMYDELKRAYSESHRHYHTGDHIIDCLSKFDSVIELIKNPTEVEIAIWFHDAVYKPYASDNEFKSANWAKNFLESSSGNKANPENVHGHIMSTLHNIPVNDNDSKLLVDIDLSILGSKSDVYQDYETAVRKEYKWVPNFIYRKKRRAILLSFLERDTIYSNNYFQEKHEEKARKNLQTAIASL